jgi:hypothetical protein
MVQEELKAQPSYSDVFQMVIPPMTGFDEGVAGDYPSQVQHALDSALQRQRHHVEAEIADFTAARKQEFKSWRDQARRQARAIARLADMSRKTPPTPPKSLTMNQSLTPVKLPGAELFEKSPVIHYSHPGASPLAAASLTRSMSDVAAPATPPTTKVVLPSIPLSSSLKSPGSSNYSKPAKRVMFQDPLSDEVQSDVDDILEIVDIPTLPTPERGISVDGILLQHIN